MLLLCCTVCGRGIWKGTMPNCSALSRLSVILLLPTSKLGPSGADSLVCGLVLFLGPRGSQETLLWVWKFLPPVQSYRFLQPEVLRFYFPPLEPWVAWCVLLPGCSCPFFCTRIWNCLLCQLPPFLPGPPVTALLHIFSTLAAVSTPPTSLDECFFFNSLVVGLPYSSIFLAVLVVFCFLNLLLSLFWLYTDASRTTS